MAKMTRVSNFGSIFKFKTWKKKWKTSFKITTIFQSWNPEISKSKPRTEESDKTKFENWNLNLKPKNSTFTQKIPNSKLKIWPL